MGFPRLIGVLKPMKEFDMESYTTLAMTPVQSSAAKARLELIELKWSNIASDRNSASCIRKEEFVSIFLIVGIDGSRPGIFNETRRYALWPA